MKCSFPCADKEGYRVKKFLAIDTEIKLPQELGVGEQQKAGWELFLV
jgi:hypothetical protein